MDNVKTRAQNLNRRMAKMGSDIRYFPQMRNGYCALDRCTKSGVTLSFVRGGTKREIAEYLHAAMQVLDDIPFSE